MILFLSFSEIKTCVYAETIGGEVSYWFVSTDVEVRSNREEIVGTDIDFNDVLDVDGSIGTPEFNGWFRFGDHHRITFGYIPLRLDGEAEIDQDITFKGTVFHIDEFIETSFDVNWFNLFYEWDIINSDYGILGIRGGAEIFSVEADLISDFASADADAGAISPAVGAFAEFYITGSLAVEAKLDAFILNIGDVDFLLFDGKGGLRWDVTPNVGLGAGLHVLRMELEVDEDRAEVTLVGPYVKGTIRF